MRNSFPVFVAFFVSVESFMPAYWNRFASLKEADSLSSIPFERRKILYSARCRIIAHAHNEEEVAIDELLSWATINGAEISSKIVLNGFGDARRVVAKEHITAGEQVHNHPLFQRCWTEYCSVWLLNVFLPFGDSDVADGRCLSSLPREHTSPPIGSVTLTMCTVFRTLSGS